jgi:hypothetical protein
VTTHVGETLDHFTKVIAERERHFNLPFSETDILKTPNDWVATICSLLSEGTNRAGSPISHDFERAMIKVAAVALAALEHVSVMEEKKTLRKDA